MAGSGEVRTRRYYARRPARLPERIVIARELV